MAQILAVRRVKSQTSQRLQDDRGDADLGIRYGRGNWRELEVKPFMPETLYPVANRALAAQLTKQRHRRGDAALLGVALARTPLAAAYLERSGLVRVSRHEAASPLGYYFVHAKGESRPHVLALIERMQRVLAAAPSK
ncbi:hypothetical protein BGV72_06205 [Burkholderia ubonensis]|nr:hypothetical protein BGV72_06205 [Burkholderia ubonensis]